jgi:hypothetical protein
MPKTRLGKVSVCFIAVMPVMFFLGGLFSNTIYKSVVAGDTFISDLTARPALSLSMLVGMLAGLTAFTTGLLAITRQKEKSPLVYVATAIGSLFILMLLGEFIFPH